MTGCAAGPEGNTAAAHESGREVRSQGLWNVGGRLAGAVGSLALVPLASRALSGTEFGVWLVLSTLSAVLAFSDLGIANAVVTDLTTSAAKGDARSFRGIVSTATALLTLIALTITGLALLMLSALDVDSLFGVPAKDNVAASTATVTYLAILGASLPLTVALRVLTASHRSDIGGKIAIAAAVLQLALGGFAAAAGAGMVAFAAVAAAPGVISGVVGWIVVVRLWPKARPTFASIHRATARRLLSRGGAYLTISVSGAIGFETDAFVIAHSLGNHRSAAYLVPAKLFLMVPALFTIYYTPLWPGVARARAYGDGPWLRAQFHRAVRIALVGGAIASLCVAILVRPAMKILSPTTAQPTFWLIVTLAGLAIVHSVSAPVAAFLSGLGMVGIQAISAGAMALANLAASILLVRSLGLTGPPLATVACQTAITLVPLTGLLIRHLNSLDTHHGYLAGGAQVP